MRLAHDRHDRDSRRSPCLLALSAWSPAEFFSRLWHGICVDILMGLAINLGRMYFL